MLVPLREDVIIKLGRSTQVRFFAMFLAILLSLSTQVSSATDIGNVSTTYALVHTAEARVVTAENACTAAKTAQNLAAKVLEQSTGQEATSLAKANLANKKIGKAAHNMYIDNDMQTFSLIIDFTQRGMPALSDNQLYQRVINKVGVEDLQGSISTAENARTASLTTMTALDDYRNKTKALVSALVECNAARSAFQAITNATGKTFLGSFVKDPFTDSPSTLSGSVTAVARALSFVGQPGLACADGACYMLCDHLAGMAWGYANSGYETAREHWAVMVASGHAHLGDTHPPLGALLFWDTGLYGHVATYVGDGMIVTNMYGAQGYGVYKIPATDVSTIWGAVYWGWTDPIFVGQKIDGGGL